jgi:hypothetical protein
MSRREYIAQVLDAPGAMGSKHFECGIGGLVLIAQVFNQFVGSGKHGIEESRRVFRVPTILKRDDYAVSQPQRFNDAGDGLMIVFHLSIIGKQAKSSQFSIRHMKNKLGHYRPSVGAITSASLPPSGRQGQVAASE